MSPWTTTPVFSTRSSVSQREMRCPANNGGASKSPVLCNSSAPPPDLPPPPFAPSVRGTGRGNVFTPPLVGGVRGGGGTDIILFKRFSSHKRQLKFLLFGFLCGTFFNHFLLRFYAKNFSTIRFGLCFFRNNACNGDKLISLFYGKEFDPLCISTNGANGIYRCPDNHTFCGNHYQLVCISDIDQRYDFPISFGGFNVNDALSSSMMSGIF